MNFVSIPLCLEAWIRKIYFVVQLQNIYIRVEFPIFKEIKLSVKGRCNGRQEIYTNKTRNFKKFQTPFKLL